MSVRFGVLGPLIAENEHGPIDLRGPRHRAVLARLLVARGRVVPVTRLVDDLWEVPPDGAVGALRTFVSTLRRALEPHRPPRGPARVLVTSGPGYALHVPDVSDVDAWRFETTVATRPPVLARLEEALDLWRGPAYGEFGDRPWARAEATRLDELRLLALERRAQALLDDGRPAEAVPDLETHVTAHPWREDAWRLLALALYRAGRQGDALGALRRARAVLATDLGVDPGPALRQLESDVLAQAPHLAAPVTAEPERPAEPAHPPELAHPSEPARPADPERSPDSADPARFAHQTRPDKPAHSPTPLVGRGVELARLDEAASAVLAGKRLGLVLVSGDAGAGKTALAEAFAKRSAAHGWTVAWGANPEDEGLPAAWPWTRILTALDGPAAPTAGSDPVAARFGWHRAVVAHLGEVANRAPLLLVLDDLHHAGEETLALLASVVTEPVRAPALLLATHRTTDPPPALVTLLGRAARAEPVRIHLGGLPPNAVSDLVQAVTGRHVDDATATAIHRRSGGNPFFVRELARLADTDLDAVPPGVRDVVRHRIAALPEPVRDAVRQAAVIGTGVDLDVLTALHGPDALDALETATRQGFLVEQAPGRFRFAHDLVRDTVYHDLSRSRRARWHAAVAETIEALRPGDVDALAHHHLLAHSPHAARYARAAAERAEHRYAPHEAARLWRAALDHAGPDTAERLAIVMGLVRALAVTGALDQARRYRAEALDLADTLDDPSRTAAVLAAFDVPAIWTANDDPALAARVVAVTERTLAQLPPTAVAERSRLLATLALESRNTGGARARAAAREAEALARELGDPAVLAFALNARFIQSFERAGLAPRRAAIGTELVDLARRHHLVTFEVLGHLILVQAHAALADLPTADHHARAADRLGEDHDLPVVSVFTQWYRAMRTSLTGDPAEAETAYRAAAARLAGTGMSGVDDGILELALLCHRLRHDLPVGEPASFGGYEPWCRPLVRPEDTGPIPDSPRDLLFEARTCLHALVAIRRGDRAAMERCRADLLPAAGELAGAGSGLVTLHPVAHYLAELDAALERD
ncbi:BTAD domain-containing putative transcriptional regulator [Actinophytocola gossypii]|uniref:BTAD domain-containing putative transcriptional regulator n=1 Tax=Actinophytocola gossypii TaxID=2812003 RepID=UPI0021A89D8D|nr:BTAD domain-containing putative transcriptional regulator [Actinophytocola gossypii]